MKINELIKNRRLQLGLTLLDVANHLGVAEATVQRYESGKIKNLKHSTIVLLAEALKTTPSYLMGWSDVDGNFDKSDFIHIHDGTISKYDELSNENKKIIDKNIEYLLHEQNKE